MGLKYEFEKECAPDELGYDVAEDVYDDEYEKAAHGKKAGGKVERVCVKDAAPSRCPTSIWLTEAELNAIKAVAKAEGVPRAEIIRRGIWAYLVTHGYQKEADSILPPGAVQKSGGRKGYVRQG